MLYRLAVETGLRRNELRSLKVLSFDFEGCTVTVEAQHTKNGKLAVLPLRVNTAAELRQFVAGKPPNTQVFKVPGATAKMFRIDLKAAGIDYVDESGRYTDFPLTATHHRDAIGCCRCSPENGADPYAT